MADDEKAVEPVRVNKWDSNAVKNALDDAVKKVLSKKFEWTEKHTLTDGRLFISFIAVCFAGFALVWDYLHPFPLSRPILIICVLSYFVLMGVLQLYIWYMEMNVFYQAVDEDPTGKQPTSHWTWSSKLKKYDDLYTLEASFKQSRSHGTASVSKSVSGWIDEDGQIILPLLQHDVVNLHTSLLTKKTK